MTANRIVQHIFQQPDIKQVDESALERLVSTYPYFTAARLLLARKQYTVHKNLLSPAVKKAQQYSNNMHYFYRFVTTDEKSMAVAEPVTAPVETAEVLAVTQPETAPVEVPVAVSEPVAEVVAPAAAAVTTALPATAEPEAVTAPINVPVAEEIIPVPAETPEVPVTAATLVTPAPIVTAPIPEAITEIPVVETPAPDPIPAFIPEAPVTAATIATEQMANPVMEINVPVAEAVSPVAEVPAAEVMAQEEEITVTEEEVIAAPVQAAAVIETPVQAATPAEPVSRPSDETDSIKIYPLDTSAPAEGALTFQPLYSDDYFAYKRLKDPVNAETLSDKGAAEMKSFTSWLREMKDTFAEKASKKWYQEQMHRSYEDANPEVSEAVEKMAMSSITLNNDIVSETLAEIWARQQQYQTAILIYQKLSLLNPNKSAYFAQKIKELQLLTEKS